MSQDELAEIDGIRPKVVLVDGEEKEVNSMSRCEVKKNMTTEANHRIIHFSNSVYKVKRTFDHFYW
jgi:DNA ligase-1